MRLSCPGLAIERLDAHTLHQCSDVLTTDAEALQSQQISQHARTGKRVCQMQLIQTMHQRQFTLT